MRLGLVGLGEAATAIATGLREVSDVEVHGFARRVHEPAAADRARRAGIATVGSLMQLAQRSDVIVCLTSAPSALGIAAEISASLRAGHVYADWNSTSPQLKRAIAEVIEPTGALFVDGAVMAAVLDHRHTVPVLVSGPGARELMTRTAGLGMQLDRIGDAPGQAAAVKMFRGLLGKGLEALVLEAVLGAHSYGVAERVLGSLNGVLDTSDWNALASYLLGRALEHAERRAAELREVSRTLTEAGVEPIVANAAVARMEWLAGRGISPAQLGEPWTHRQVVELALGRRGSQGGTGEAG